MAAINRVDVLCIGHASFDLIFTVPVHPKADDKIVANSFSDCGGGPAANAAVMASRLGLKAAFSGYLGDDFYGEKHYQELLAENISTELIVRGHTPTPLSTIIVKPTGERALINYKGDTQALSAGAIDFSGITPKVILADGHEPKISLDAIEIAHKKSIPTILDAGSLHAGTELLMDKVDYLICSEKFAHQFARDASKALRSLSKISANVVITLGDKGVIWQRGNETDQLPAYHVETVDSTGAGDAFHGAFAAALAKRLNWNDSLRYASAAGALCCTKIGARTGLPYLTEHQALFKKPLSH